MRWLNLFTHLFRQFHSSDCTLHILYVVIVGLFHYFKLYTFRKWPWTLNYTQESDLRVSVLKLFVEPMISFVLSISLFIVSTQRYVYILKPIFIFRMRCVVVMLWWTLFSPSTTLTFIITHLFDCLVFEITELSSKPVQNYY